MLAKLKIAVVLLVIGMFSGVSIWGVNTWTAPIIEKNQARAQAEMYRQIFADLDYVEIEDYDHDIINQKVRVFDASGNEIGAVLRGRVTNNFGYVQALVGISNDGKLAKVLISDHTNTPNYANIIISNHLDDFTGQDVTNVQYDANTGATETYNAVRRIVEAAIMETAGDVLLEIYQDFYPTAATYEDDSNIRVEGFNTLVSVYDNDKNLLGYVYEGSGIRVFINVDEEFIGISALDLTDSELIATLSSFTRYYNTDLSELEFDLEGDDERSIVSILEPIINIYANPYRKFFEDAAEESDEIEVEFEFINAYRNYYDDEGGLVGRVYHGTAQAQSLGGFDGGDISIYVAINMHNEITYIEIGEHNNTQSYLNNNVIPNLDSLYGKTSVDSVSGNDVFSGATSSGNAVLEIIEEALDVANLKRFFESAASKETVDINDDSSLNYYIKYFDNEDKVIGYVYHGTTMARPKDYFDGGEISIYVALNTSNEIVSITIGEHNNTQNYLNRNVIPNLSTLYGKTNVDDVNGNDAFTGSTSSGNAVLEIVQDVLEYRHEGSGE